MTGALKKGTHIHTALAHHYASAKTVNYTDAALWDYCCADIDLHRELSHRGLTPSPELAARWSRNLRLRAGLACRVTACVRPWLWCAHV